MRENSRTTAEREFHNASFANDSGSLVGSSKYYLALERWYEHYISEALNHKVEHVLEIGAGMESISLQVENCPFELLSVDISEEAISLMNRNYQRNNLRFEVQDAHNTSFADSSFDALIGRGILHHLDIAVACAEIKRVLKQGGKIVFGEPLDCNILINIYRGLTPQIRTKDERPLSFRDLLS